MDNNDVFAPYLNDIFNTQNTKDDSVDAASQNQTIIEQYLNFLYNGSLITQSYHYSIMKQAQILLVVFSALFTASTIFVFAVIGILLFSKNGDTLSKTPLIVGGIVDLFSGVLIIVLNKLLKSRDCYFLENVKSEHFSKVIGLISTVKDEEKEFVLIEKIVDHYCSIHKNTS